MNDNDTTLLIKAQVRGKCSNNTRNWFAVGFVCSLMVNVSLLVANYHTYQALLQCFGE